MLQETGIATRAHETHVAAALRDRGYTPFFISRLVETVKPVRTPVAILGSLGVCIYGPTSRHGLISYSPIHLT